MTTILKINSSARLEGSHSRRLVDEAVSRLDPSGTAQIIERDLAGGVEFVDASWVEASFTPIDQRTGDQRERLSGSDALLAELRAADVLVIGVPIYNFGVPAVLKAWVDQICRANVTFRYSPDGPVGLLEGKRAVVVVASGGTAADSDVDFATPFLRHVLGFIGITDVEFVLADRLMADEAAALDGARASLDRLAA